ncbi:MAG: S8 family serine peptidase [Arenicellales bacterium]
MKTRQLQSLFIFILLCVAGAAQAGNDPELTRLLGSDKIIRAPNVLAPFSAGADKVKVIVTLRPSSQVNALHRQSLLSISNPAKATQQAGKSVYFNLKDESIRSGLQQTVAQKLNVYTNGLNRSKINVTRKFTYVFGFAAEVTLAGLTALKNDPEVLAIEEDLILQPHLNQGISLINGVAARSNYNGAGVSVAVTDTGIDYTHPMLGNGGFPNSKVIGGYDFGMGDANPIPSGISPNAHGTAVAGIIAGNLGATGDYIGGVAPAAKLYALKISNDSDHSATSSAMIAAWEWALTHQNDDANNPILVINTSFGGGEYTSSCDSALSSMTQAAANAVAGGISIFVSSGNDGFCSSMGWPACITHVNSVGAVYDANIGTAGFCVSTNSCLLTSPNPGCPAGTEAFFESTFADKVTSYSNSASFLTFFASSNNAYTTDISGAPGYAGGDYTTGFGGTSAAAPYAAGAAAVLQHAAMSITGSYLTPADVRDKFQTSGDLITDSKVAITKPRINLGDAVATLSTNSGISLLLNEEDTTKWGWNYEGIDSHKESILFQFDSNGSDRYFHVTGYDVDWPDELCVYLNDLLVECLITGPNNAHTASQVITLPISDQASGSNLLEIRQRVSGWTWGVTNVGLYDDLGLSLLLNAEDATKWGWNYEGIDSHKESILFQFDSNGSDRYFHVTGYDVDWPDELCVYLNDLLVECLITGPNNAHTASQVITLPISDQVSGSNLLEIRQRVSGWTWGVTNVGLYDDLGLSLLLNAEDTTKRGWNYEGIFSHREGILFNFESNGSDRHLHVTGYDIDQVDEVCVYLNDLLVECLSKGLNNALTAPQVIMLPVTSQVSGSNLLEIRQKTPGWKWGVTNVGLFDVP